MKRQPRQTQATITRTIKATRAAGVEVAEVRVMPDGEVRLLIGERRRDDQFNEWDAA